MKTLRVKFPWDLYRGKQNIEAKKLYSYTLRGVGGAREN